MELIRLPMPTKVSTLVNILTFLGEDHDMTVATLRNARGSLVVEVPDEAS